MSVHEKYLPVDFVKGPRQRLDLCPIATRARLRNGRARGFDNRGKEEAVSVEIADLPAGLLAVKITGKLKKPDLERAQASALETIRKHGKVRLLVIATDFLGWERGGDWSDVSSREA
jgi:hypothetical protein